MPFTPHPITLRSCCHAAGVLARAFVNDPVTVAVYPNFTARRRERALKVDFAAEILECVRRGCPLQIDIDGEIMAAAVVYPPATYPLPLFTQWKLLAKSIWGNGIYDLRPWMRWTAQVEKCHPAMPHFYLAYLGVDPDQQGKSLGSTLLEYLTCMAADQGMGCYLENANPRNLTFYQRHGFEIIDKQEIIGIHTWFMWHKP